MLLDNKHPVELKKGYLEEIVTHLPTPDDLIGKTLFVDWSEEAGFDAVAGLMWPAMVGIALAQLYQAKGHVIESFGAKIDFVGDEEEGGCLLTFCKTA